MKVLVVDDESLIRKALVRAFKGKGHFVEDVDNGITGFEKLISNEYDLVFLDILMPGKSGPELMKDRHLFKSKSYILMSAYSGEHNLETANSLNADMFLPKPFDDIFEIVKLAEKLVESKG